MLKKAGIVVAASAASLLALSPLAFAGDKGGDHGHKGGHHGAENVIDKDAKGLIAGLNGNNLNVPIQACNNNIPVNVLGVQVPVEDASALNGLTGALGILGDAKAKSGDSVTDQSDNCGQEAGAGDSIG
ncbi:hypothetical protein FVA95_18790 [Pseudonocardia sp. EV170527-09]|uniref:hypothetical protein n=1 Tax=Pseudonocardia sp. EV170527-09 TaxID=2603411 RepID=UPI0011F24B83|nr:hypothetical protein [Pseudonocardia sp. EV170527-09]KAA1023144.1 hypothetical protein FVA95_18790 [Pseudonocardia sp. EV170527-09]